MPRACATAATRETAPRREGVPMAPADHVKRAVSEAIDRRAERITALGRGIRYDPTHGAT